MRFPSAILCVAALAFVSAPAFAAVHPRTVLAEEKESELGKLMGQMGKHFKALKKEVGEADKKESSAEHFAKIAELAEKCKAHPPETAKTDEDKKAYAAGLDQTVALAKAGAEAAKAGKTEEVDVKSKASADIKCDKGCTLTLGGKSLEVDAKTAKVMIKDGHLVAG